MNPTQHPSNNRVLGGPKGWDHSALPVSALPITDNVINNVPGMASFWRPNAGELATLNDNGLVMLNVIGVNMPPVSVGVIAMPENEDAKQFSGERKHLYISGPMTGLPEYNYPAFHAAARDLRAAGYIVSNPAERSLPADAPWIEHMRKDIRMMSDCDGIATLDGWQQSKGANAEINLFHNLGLPVFTLVAWLALAKPSKSEGAAA